MYIYIYIHTFIYYNANVVYSLVLMKYLRWIKMSGKRINVIILVVLSSPLPVLSPTGDYFAIEFLIISDN